MERQEVGRGCRVVLVPIPAQGHLYPMTQLGLALYNRGFSITIIHSTFISPSPAQYPNFDLKPIPDGLSEMKSSTTSPDESIKVLNKSCEAPFRKCILELVEGTGKEERIVNIISDMFIFFTKNTAMELGIPMYVFWTTNLISFLAMSTSVHLRKIDPTLNLDRYDSEELVAELPPLRKKDLIILDSNDQATLDSSYETMDVTIKNAMQSSGIIFNSFEFLEQSDWIAKFKQQYGSPFFFPIALHNINDSPPSFHSMLTPNADCIQWLDQQEHNSVMDVSFGSGVTITKSQLLEIAQGLARSKVPFLWVLRSGMVIGEEHINLPDETKEIVESKRGFVVDWAPQREVLAHPSVGGFWTHCGWNSVTESICAGVSMICTPWEAEQHINSRFLTQVWKIGIEMEKEALQSEVVEKTIRKLMAEEEGVELKQNVGAFKEKALDYAIEGGPSFINFVQSIISTS